MIEKLVKLVDCLWERKPVYKELISMEKLKEVKRALLNSTFHTGLEKVGVRFVFFLSSGVGAGR